MIDLKNNWLEKLDGLPLMIQEGIRKLEKLKYFEISGSTNPEILKLQLLV